MYVYTYVQPCAVADHLPNVRTLCVCACVCVCVSVCVCQAEWDDEESVWTDLPSIQGGQD